MVLELNLLAFIQNPFTNQSCILSEDYLIKENRGLQMHLSQQFLHNKTSRDLSFAIKAKSEWRSGQINYWFRVLELIPGI